jgi:hypothetical protein
MQQLLILLESSEDNIADALKLSGHISPAKNLRGEPRVTGAYG